MTIRKGLLAGSLALALLAMQGPASAAAVYNYDGGVGNGTWKDVNKANPLASVMCWACSAANNLAWTGWRGWDTGTNSHLDTEQKIFDYFSASWGNFYGSPFYGYQWWFSGNEQDPDDNPVAGSGNFYPGVYNPANPPAANPFAFIPSSSKNLAEGSIAAYINSDRGVSISIEGLSDGGINYLHTLTVWGIDIDNDQIWITDSDDAATQLVQYSYFFNAGTNSWFIDNYSNAYTTNRDFEIGDVYRLNLNADGLEPRHENPEPGSLLLLAAGLAGVSWARRRHR